MSAIKCTECGVVRELSGTRCLPCIETRKTWYRRNRTKSASAAKRWKKDNPEKVNSAKRRKRLRDLYNITPEEYDLILAEQGGVCAISGRPAGKVRLSCDHCHTSGLIRGLLDWKMNKAIAMFEDSPEFLRAAAAYLESPPAVRALHGPRYGMIGKAKTGKRKTLYGSPNGPQSYRDLSR